MNSDSKFKRVSKTLAGGGGGTAPRRQGQRWADTRPAAAGDLGGRESVRARRGRAGGRASGGEGRHSRFNVFQSVAAKRVSEGEPATYTSFTSIE